MSLLDDVIDASGGLAHWNGLSRFTLHLSIGGTLFDGVGRANAFKDVTAEGSTRSQSIRFTGISGGTHSGSFQSDAITIETWDGKLLRFWRNPSLAFPHSSSAVLSDELHLVFFCGVAIWTHLSSPFLLARPDVDSEELPSTKDSWRRLRAHFPSDLITLAPEQVFHFDPHGLQRRTDHDLFGMNVVHCSWAHESFGGVVVPTLRRARRLDRDGTVVAKPVLMDIEIFDALFE